MTKRCKGNLMKQKNIDTRLVPFIGDDQDNDNMESFFPGDYLMPISKLYKSLDEYSAKIQEAVEGGVKMKS